MNTNDYKLYTKYINDLEVGIGSESAEKLITAQRKKEILERLSAERYNFPIVDKDTDITIGRIGLMKVNFIYRTSGLGIFIGDKSYWNKGYGRESIELALDYRFNILNLYNIN